MSFPISINENRLRFGTQDVPIGNAKTARFFLQPERGIVVILGLDAVDGRAAKYKLLTGTYEKTAYLFREIISKTDIKVHCEIKNIIQRDDGLDFEFSSGDASVFCHFIAPHFFPDAKITREPNLVKIDIKQKQVEKITAIFQSMAAKIGNFQVIDSENPDGIPKFIVELQDKQVIGLKKTRVFVLDGKEFSEIIPWKSGFGLITCTQNIMLEWIYGF